MMRHVAAMALAGLSLGGASLSWAADKLELTTRVSGVVAEVLGHGRGKKILVSKFKAKVQYRRKKGHRQPYTELLIKEIRG